MSSPPLLALAYRSNAAWNEAHKQVLALLAEIQPETSLTTLFIEHGDEEHMLANPSNAYTAELLAPRRRRRIEPGEGRLAEGYGSPVLRSSSSLGDLAGQILSVVPNSPDEGGRPTR